MYLEEITLDFKVGQSSQNDARSISFQLNKIRNVLNLIVDLAHTSGELSPNIDILSRAWKNGMFVWETTHDR